MSYILEALKKAQAERQLGNAPDIHAPAPTPLPAAAAKSSRKPLLIGLGVGLAVAGLAGTERFRRLAFPAVMLLTVVDVVLLLVGGGSLR